MSSRRSGSAASSAADRSAASPPVASASATARSTLAPRRVVGRLRAIVAAVTLASALGTVGMVHADEIDDISRLMRAGQLDQALQRADAHLATRPRNAAQTRFLRGLILTEQNRIPDAIMVFQRLSEDYPELPEPYNNLAVLYAAQGQYDKARASLEMAIRTHPSYATAHENLGDVYAKLASQAYDKALQLDSANAGAQTKLSLIRDLVSGQRVPPTPRSGNSNAPLVPPMPAPPTSPVPAQPAGTQSSFLNHPIVRFFTGGPESAAAPAPAPATPSGPAPSPGATVPPWSAPAPAPARAVSPAPAPAVPPVAARSGPTTLPAAGPSAMPGAAQNPTPAPATSAGTAGSRGPAAGTPPLLAQSGAAVAPAPAKAAAPAPAPAPAPANPRAAEVAEVTGAVQDWAKAWAAQDMKTYLAAYDKSFNPGRGLTREQWEKERHARIVGKARISVTLENVQVDWDGPAAKVKFRQHYKSDQLSTSSSKTLVLTKTNGKWLIKQERTG